MPISIVLQSGDRSKPCEIRLCPKYFAISRGKLLNFCFLIFKVNSELICLFNITIYLNLKLFAISSNVSLYSGNLMEKPFARRVPLRCSAACLRELHLLSQLHNLHWFKVIDFQEIDTRFYISAK